MAKATKVRKAPDPSKPAPLVFEHVGELDWEASSCISDDGSPFKWVIGCRVEDGRFSIIGSDSELYDARIYKDVTFTTFAAAKNVCQSLDDGLRQAMKNSRG